MGGKHDNTVEKSLVGGEVRRKKGGGGEKKKKKRGKKKKEIIIRDVVESFVDNHGPTIIVIVNKVQHAALLNSTSTKRIIQNT